jgi:hypothetical protein
MKYCLVTLAALMVAASSYAQGTLNFNNKITGSVDARVTYNNGGSPVPADGMYMAQLYASAPGGTLAAVGDPVPFRDTPDAGKGYLNATGRDLTRTVPGVAENGTAQVQVKAWATSLGATYEEAAAKGLGGTGVSGILASVATGGGLNPPGALIGLQPFEIATIVPEPSIAALGLLGAGLLLIRRKK